MYLFFKNISLPLLYQENRLEDKNGQKTQGLAQQPWWEMTAVETWVDEDGSRQKRDLFRRQSEQSFATDIGKRKRELEDDSRYVA